MLSGCCRIPFPLVDCFFAPIELSVDLLKMETGSNKGNQIQFIAEQVMSSYRKDDKAVNLYLEISNNDSINIEEVSIYTNGKVTTDRLQFIGEYDVDGKEIQRFMTQFSGCCEVYPIKVEIDSPYFGSSNNSEYFSIALEINK